MALAITHCNGVTLVLLVAAPDNSVHTQCGQRADACRLVELWLQRFSSGTGQGERAN